MLNDVIESKANIIGDTRCIRAINDAGFQGGKDFCEIHNDRFGTKFLKNFGFHTWRRTEFPILEVISVTDWLGGRQRFLAWHPPSDQFHVELVVELLRGLETTAVVEP